MPVLRFTTMIAVMEFLPLLAANSTKPTGIAAYGIGEMLFYGMTAILVVVLIVSGLIVREAYRKNYGNAGLVGLLMFGSILGPLIVMQITARGWIPAGIFQVVILFGGIATWLGTLIFYTAISSRKQKEDHEREQSDRSATQRELYRDDGASAQYAERVRDPQPEARPEPEQAPTGPRRAVSFPAAESDSQRASEQTLKRMTMEDIESASSVEKPPRAGEIPENPILPDGPCKVRCLACDKKMKADGARFMRQRRCPNCKAAPFRYVTAV